MTHADPEIEKRFTYHALGEEAKRRSGDINALSKALAYDFQALCPASRELSLALTKLQEARNWANAAIACNQELLPAEIPY